METLYVCMTMDVERILAFSSAGGPPTWEFGEKSVRNYCELLAVRGLPTTLFVVPDTAVEQGAILKAMAESTRSELGMHLHPQFWGKRALESDAHDCLGAYDERAQRQLLSEALNQTTEGLGVRPRAFRAGNFSANDATFGVLTELGFTHGSVSQPGRAVSRVKAVWRDACPDVHRAHRAFRMIPGDLDFIEVPLTSDRERMDHWTGVGDVRIEGTTPEHLAKAVRQEVTRQIEEKAALKHVCFLTHNFVNYWSEDESKNGKRRVLAESIEKIMHIAEELGLRVQGATIGEVRRVFLEGEKTKLRGI